tara:strand:- start:152 stop:532 length:381 start_codon:yes stop_codon:yes gene_type:complete
MVKKTKQATVNSLAAFMDGLNVNDKQEQPKKKLSKKDPTDLLLGNMKKLNLTGKTQFKQPRTLGTKKSGTKKSRTKIPEYSRMNLEKKKQVFKRRTLSARNADDKLSEALDKLGLGTKKKKKKKTF